MIDRCGSTKDYLAALKDIFNDEYSDKAQQEREGNQALQNISLFFSSELSPKHTKDGKAVAQILTNRIRPKIAKQLTGYYEPKRAKREKKTQAEEKKKLIQDFIKEDVGIDNTRTEITNPFEYPTQDNSATPPIAIVNSSPPPPSTKKKRGIVVPNTRATVPEIQEFISFAMASAPRGYESV